MEGKYIFTPFGMKPLDYFTDISGRSPMPLSMQQMAQISQMPFPMQFPMMFPMPFHMPQMPQMLSADVMDATETPAPAPAPAPAPLPLPPQVPSFFLVPPGTNPPNPPDPSPPVFWKLDAPGARPPPRTPEEAKEVEEAKTRPSLALRFIMDGPGARPPPRTSSQTKAIHVDESASILSKTLRQVGLELLIEAARVEDQEEQMNPQPPQVPQIPQASQTTKRKRKCPPGACDECYASHLPCNGRSPFHEDGPKDCTQCKRRGLSCAFTSRSTKRQKKENFLY